MSELSDYQEPILNAYEGTESSHASKVEAMMNTLPRMYSDVSIDEQPQVLEVIPSASLGPVKEQIEELEKSK